MTDGSECFREVKVEVSKDHEKLNKMIREWRDLKAEKSFVASRYKAQIDELEEKIFAMSNEGSRITVACKVVFDIPAKVKRIVRGDTGEVVEELPLTEADLQQDAFEQTEKETVEAEQDEPVQVEAESKTEAA